VVDSRRERVLRRILKRFGIEENKKRGKGSHRMFVGVVEGRLTHYPTRCHNENEDKPIAVIEAIRRHFQLIDEHGVADEELYGA
jgi:hypothetical protein